MNAGSKWPGIAALAVAGLIFCAPAADAGFLGKPFELFSVTGDIVVIPPAPTTVDTLMVSGTVGGQTEYDGNFDFIDLSDNTVRLGNNDRHCVGTNCPITPEAFGDFFGFRIVDYLNRISPIIGVSIHSSSIPGFVIGDITFSENEIFIGIEDLAGFSPGDVIPNGEAVLNVTFATVPEPAPGVLFAAALLGIFAVRRRNVSRESIRRSGV